MNYVFIVTDGETDFAGPCTYGHCTSAFDPAKCDDLKTKATVGVIYTTYLPIWHNNDPSTKLYEDAYSLLVKDNKDQIAPNLQKCATSSDYYFEAKDGPAIVAAMNALFIKTQPTTARLTQ